MATLYGSTGEKLNEGISVSLADIETRLRGRGYDANDITRTPTTPQLGPVHKWATYVLIEVFESESKTKLFPKSGVYHLRGLSVKTAGFLLKP